jgi:hypothetical protein
LNEVSQGFVVARYLLGARGDELLDGLVQEPDEPTRALCRALADPDQRRRAEALKKPLYELVLALDARILDQGRSP